MRIQMWFGKKKFVWICKSWNKYGINVETTYMDKFRIYTQKEYKRNKRNVNGNTLSSMINQSDMFIIILFHNLLD